MAPLRGLLASGALVLASSKELIKGIAYGPVPLKGKGTLTNDDFMSSNGKPLWGDYEGGRGDLKVIKATGANAVRLYGNDPSNDHTEFLDEVQALGMEAIPGMSDWPYTQMPGNCLSTGLDCEEQVKKSYLGNLQKGFVRADGSYHPAMRLFIIVNEPELKLGKINEPATWGKALLSAVDGMLAAEDAEGTTGNLPNFTIVFSYGVCSADLCKTALSESANKEPALGQMVALKRMMEDPSLAGYTPKHDLKKVYRTRYTQSFNTANPSPDMEIFMKKYEKLLPDTPVFIGEYHSYYVGKRSLTQEKDLKAMVRLAESSSVFMGFNFFEFQRRYDKGGEEELFGTFGLGDALRNMTWTGKEYEVSCLEPQHDELTKESLYDAIALAFSGSVAAPGVGLCGSKASAASVPVSSEGFVQVQGLQDAGAMAVFIRRLIEALGGTVSSEAHVTGMAANFVGASAKDFGALMAYLGELRGVGADDPRQVADWDLLAGCVADRGSTQGSVGEAVGYACGQLGGVFDCAADVPSSCSADFWQKADYILSIWYGQSDAREPFRDCHFGGAAQLASAAQIQAVDPDCVVTANPSSAALSEDGYAKVKGAEASRLAEFIRREALKLGYKIQDEKGIVEFASNPPSTFSALESAIKAAPQWLCGGDSGRACLASSTTTTMTVTRTMGTTTTATTSAPAAATTTTAGSGGSSGGGGMSPMLIALIVTLSLVFVVGLGTFLCNRHPDRRELPLPRREEALELRGQA